MEVLFQVALFALAATANPTPATLVAYTLLCVYAGEGAAAQATAGFEPTYVNFEPL